MPADRVVVFVVFVVFDGMKLLDAARSALDAGRSVADAARIAGFGSAETLRRVFVTQLGISPKAYRDRFKSTG